MAPSWLALPSLLPSNLQKRLLSYALTHVLGTFLEPQTFSLENLELQLLDGSVTLRNLELNAAKVNTLVKIPGIKISEGRVAQVSLQIPVRDVLSGRISVKINGISVHVRPCGEADRLSEPVSELSADSLAQSFLQSSIHDPADSVLLDNLSHSMPDPEELGLGPAESEGVFTTILAGFVDALKARLAIEIDGLVMHVQHPRSGAFILRLAKMSFLPYEEKLSEKLLTIKGIEAFLQNESPIIGDGDDDNESVSSTSTVTSPSPTNGRRGSSPPDHGLSESIMFSSQEAESLYMSAYSQPARSSYMTTVSYALQAEESAEPPPGELPDSNGVEQGFRFFYFEDDIVLHVTTSLSETSIPRTRPAPVLKSALPTAHLFLNPQVNLLPSISLISTILSLSPTSSAPPPTPVSQDDTGGLDFLWTGGVVIHFGSESDETIARLADWKVKKQVNESSLSISIGQVEILSSTNRAILSLEKSRRLDVVVLPDMLQISLPEVNLHVDLGGVGSLEPLVKAMKQAWQDSLVQTQSSQQPRSPTEESENEGWNENLIVEDIVRPPPGGKPVYLEIKRLEVLLETIDGTIQLGIEEISTRIHPSQNNSLQFSKAVISIPSSPRPLLEINRSNGVPTINFVPTGHDPRLGFLVNGAQEILDDFLVGEPSRSDDAWGMIRADAANTSDVFMKIRLPRVDVRIAAARDIDAVDRVLRRIQKTAMLFVGETGAPVQQEREDDQIDLVVEFVLDEGYVGVELDKNEAFEATWEGIEGTLVNGVAGGELLGNIEVTRLQAGVDSPESPRKVLHESIQKGNDSTPGIAVRFVHSNNGQVISRVGLYNLNFEYHVFNPWLDKLSKVLNPTHHTDSITHTTLANPESFVLAPAIPPPAQLNMTLSDCTVGLNPLDLPSRGLLLITSTTIRGEWDFRDGGRGKFDVSLNRVHLFCIDDTANLTAALRPRVRSSGRKEILAYFTELGYALCATMPTGNATVRFLLAETRSEIDVEDVSIQLDTCADSTQTLGDLFNCLKPPIEIDEGRYKPGNRETINVLKDIDEHAFAGDFKVAREIPQTDEDFVTDDVPYNLAFVESYYGDQSRIKSSPSSSRIEHSIAEEHGDELLAEGDSTYVTSSLTIENDIGHFAEPPKPATPVERGKFGEFEEQIRVFGSSGASSRTSSSSVQFVDEHFPTHSILKEKAFLKTDALMKLKLRNTRVVWNLHDGYDWPKTRDVIAQAVARVEQKAAEAMAAKARRKTPQPTRTVTLPEVLYGEDPYAFDEDEDEKLDDDSEIGDILFNSIYVGVRRGQDPRSLARNINRDLDAQSETTSQVSTTPSTPLPSWRGASSSPGGGVLDRTRRKALRLKRSRAQKVQINLRNLGVDFDLLREPTEPGQTQLSTLRLRVGDLEILDNVPTSSWNKFVTYWRNGDKRRRETASAMVDLEVVNVKPVHTLSASELVVKARVLPLKLHVDQDTLDFITRFFEFKDQSATPPTGLVPEPPFLQRVEVFPVNVMLDYKPKKVDYAGLRSGRTTEFMNFFTLEEAEILLRNVTLYGISGLPKLFQRLNDFWMPDIRGTQLLDVLGGINYVRPFANIGGGVRDLIVVPLKEYQKDGRLLKGTGKGVAAFGKTVGKEFVKVGAKMAIGAQKGLEWGEGLIEGRPAASTGREGVRFDDDEFDDEFDGDPRVVTLSPYADQPANIRQGIKRAVETLVRNAKSAGETVIAIPQEVAESGSAAGAGKTVLKAIPVAIIRPLIGASGAVSNTLMGIHNTLDSNQQQNIEDKYKR